MASYYFMNIYLHGPDTFRSRQQMKKMVAKFKVDRDPQRLNVVILDIEKEEPGNVLQQILATPFLAERRMIVLENLLSATSKKDLQEEIFNRVKDKKISESNVLLFWESGNKPKTDIAKKLQKLLAKEKFAQEFAELKGVQLGSWIKQEVEERGGKIQPQAVQYLVANVGGDSWLLSSLVEQLVAYVADADNPSPTLPYKGREIGVSDVQLFLDERADDNIFNLVDAIVAKQPKQVFRMIREQYTQGKDPHYVFAMILRQFRILLELRDVYDREDNIGSNDLAKKLGLHPFVVKKSLPFVKRYTLDQLKNIYQSLLEFDIKTKTGGSDQSVLLDVFVGNLCIL